MTLGALDAVEHGHGATDHAAGTAVSAETVRGGTETVVAGGDAQLRDEAAIIRNQGTVGPVDSAPDRLRRAGTDGMVGCRDGWHEVKLGVVGGWGPGGGARAACGRAELVAARAGGWGGGAGARGSRAPRG